MTIDLASLHCLGARPVVTDQAAIAGTKCEQPRGVRRVSVGEKQ